MFRDWQGTHTQSSVKAPSGRRQHMDVWFCVWQEPRREAHRRAASSALLRLTHSSLARVRRIVFSLDKDLSWKSANRRCGPHLHCESDLEGLPKSLTKRKSKNAPVAGGSVSEPHASKSITFWKGVTAPLFRHLGVRRRASLEMVDSWGCV